MLALRFTIAVAVGALLLAAAEKPSPFPEKRAAESMKDGGAADRPAESGPPAMEGTATFFHLKADQPTSDFLTAAHSSLPLGSQVKVINEGNGKVVVVRITDRFAPSGTAPVISVSQPAAVQLGFARIGTAKVKLELIAKTAAP